METVLGGVSEALRASPPASHSVSSPTDTPCPLRFRTPFLPQGQTPEPPTHTSHYYAYYCAYKSLLLERLLPTL